MAAMLFDEIQFRETTVPNRIVVSPMCQYSAPDGMANEWHSVHLGSRAVGGTGIVMTEATAVSPEGRISPEDLGIWTDAHASALEPIASFIREQGSVPAIQLAHAGRKASTARPWEGRDPVLPEDGGWSVIAPSDRPYPREGETPPLEPMTSEDIDRLVTKFADAARRARSAGFEIAEIHAAHGYLLHEFLSPVSNRRTDEYGGSFENRIRLVLEVTRAVREVWPDEQPIFVRISATDWLDDPSPDERPLDDRDSWDVDQSVALASRLTDAGADLIDVSSGGISPEQEIEWVGPGYQVRFAERIREEAGVPVGAVGGITDATHADAIVRNDRADLAIVGREHLRDPYFALNAAQELGVDLEWPPQYRRAKPE